MSRFRKMVTEMTQAAAAPLPQEEDDDEAFFSLSDVAVLDRLRKMSPLTRICSYYKNTTGRDMALVNRPLHEVDVEDFRDICSVFGVLGASRWITGPLGQLEERAYADAQMLPSYILKAGIVGPKIASVDCFTDYNLIRHLACVEGVVAKPGTAGLIQIYVPGWNKSIDVSDSVTAPGKALNGAMEYLEWRKATQSKNYEYRVIPADVIKLARYCASRFVCEMKEGKLHLAPRPYPIDKRVKLNLPTPPILLNKLSYVIVSTAKELHGDKKNNPTGVSMKDRPIEYLTWVLSSGWRKWNDDDKSAFQGIIKQIDDHAADCIASLSKAASSATPEGLCNGDHLINVLSKTITHGALLEYVKAHRETLRNTPAIDVPRKSDGTPLARVAGSASSVPWKIRAATEYMTVEDPKVDAYGTKSNWWRAEVDRVAGKSAAEVRWRDIDQKNEVKGRDFAVADILALPPGSGKGRSLLDDTMVTDFTRKLRAIIGAGYEEFATKMYLGADGDAGTLLGAGLSPAVAEACKEYTMFWSPGGSPHSPEYFLVGINKGIPTEEDARYDLQDAYVIHASQMVRHNMYRSAQVHAGSLVSPPQWVPYDKEFLKEVRWGGKEGAKAPTVDVPATPNPEGAVVRRSKFFRDPAEPIVAPVVKSQLNGTKGEVTNGDDVAWVPPAAMDVIYKSLRGQSPLLMPNSFPDNIQPFRAWFMRAPGYGKSKGIKLQGFAPSCNPLVHYSIGRYNQYTVYVFQCPDWDVRLYMCVPYAKGAPAARVQEERTRALDLLMGDLCGPWARLAPDEDTDTEDEEYDEEMPELIPVKGEKEAVYISDSTVPGAFVRPSIVRVKYEPVDMD